MLNLKEVEADFPIWLPKGVMIVSNFFNLQHFVFKKGVYISQEYSVKFQTAWIENVYAFNVNSIIIIFSVALRPNTGHGLLILEVF